MKKLGYLTKESYLLAIRNTLKHDTLILQRSPSEIRINSITMLTYSKPDKLTWTYNMLLLDPCACATYILSYITKGQRGMSRLLQKASEEAKAGNKDISNIVRHIGNKFLNAVEISAQEAVYRVSQIPLKRSSRDVQFINTSPPDERTSLIKKLEKLKQLADR